MLFSTGWGSWWGATKTKTTINVGGGGQEEGWSRTRDRNGDEGENRGRGRAMHICIYMCVWRAKKRGAIQQEGGGSREREEQGARRRGKGAKRDARGGQKDAATGAAVGLLEKNGRLWEDREQKKASGTRETYVFLYGH